MLLAINDGSMKNHEVCTRARRIPPCRTSIDPVFCVLVTQKRPSYRRYQVGLLD